MRLSGMTTTLLQRPTAQLELLLWSRQLQKARFDEVAALRFLSNAIVSLRDAKTPEISAIGRYLFAHHLFAWGVPRAPGRQPGHGHTAGI